MAAVHIQAGVVRLQNVTIGGRSSVVPARFQSCLLAVRACPSHEPPAPLAFDFFFCSKVIGVDKGASISFLGQVAMAELNCRNDNDRLGGLCAMTRMSARRAPVECSS
jgi:hypothetical protein